MNCLVPSSEPSSITRISSQGTVWARTESRAWLRKGCRLYVGMMTEINGDASTVVARIIVAENRYFAIVINLLLGDKAGYDPETGSECLRSSLCNIYPD